LPGEAESSLGLPAARRSYWYQSFDILLSSSGTANSQLEASESQSRTALAIHLDLLEGLLVATPSKTPASIADDCIRLYTQYVFGTVPMCHEAALRATAGRFFISDSDEDDPSEKRARILRGLAVDDERQRIEALRSLTLPTALCGAVTYVVPEYLLPNKHLTAPLFLRASRETLRIYEDYDLEHRQK
jgi:hypothetical protein